MEIENGTQWPAAIMLGNGPDGRPTLTVIIKVTFRFSKEDRKASWDESQLPIAGQDEFYGDDIQRGIRIETDMSPYKPGADIVLVGTAHAPQGRAVLTCETALRVGNVAKKVRVYGDRRWIFGSKLALSPTISSPEPFVTMELTYERAFGGIDEHQGMWCSYNFLGRGYAGKKKPESLHHKPLPNLEDPGNPIVSWDTNPMPAGYGFWPRGCLPRSKFAGTFDEKWLKEKKPERPPGFSFQFFNAAHPDLQMRGFLRGDEIVEMLNLTPQGYQKFQLAAIHPKSSIERTDGGREDMKLNLDTLCFFPEESLFYQVWRGLYPVRTLECEEIKKIFINMS